MRRHIHFILVIIFTISSCDKTSNQELSEGMTDPGSMPQLNLDNFKNSHEVSAASNIKDQNDRSAAKSDPSVISNKLIKTVRMGLKVNDVEEDLKYISRQATQMGGYMGDFDHKMNRRLADSKKLSSDTLEQTTSIEHKVTAVVKVPAERLEEFLIQVESTALQMDYKTSDVQDVTGKIIDLQSRKEIKLKIEKKYISILEHKTANLKEILEVERKIDRIREEIEVMEGKLKHLNKSVALSTIHLSLYQDPVYQTSLLPTEKQIVHEDRFNVKAQTALLAGWTLMKDLVIALFYLWPLIVLVTFIIGYLYLRKRFKLKYPKST